MAEPVPKQIHVLWLQGRDAAPDIVKFNLDRWEKANPSFALRVWDEAAVRDLLAGTGLALETASRQSLSDIFRAKLLLDQGGVWADASVLPVCPLDDWLDTSPGFFAFEREDVPLSSWFLVASPGHGIMRAWWSEVRRLWVVPRRVSTELVLPADPAGCVAPDQLAGGQELPYFWFHCLFARVLRTEPEAAETWADRKHVSAMPAHEVQNLFRVKKRPSGHELARAMAASPLQKLDWRFPYPLRRLEEALADPTPPRTWFDKLVGR